MHTVTDRVPTSWFAGIFTVAFLTVTAAFGGLATAAEPEPPVIDAGDAHVNDQLSLTIERAVLIDELGEAGAYPEPGQRVLAVIATAENRWTQPLPTGGGFSVSDAVRIPALGDVPPDSVARLDDATIGPYLQPGVPAELVLTWIVDADAFSGDETVRLDLRDETLITGKLVAAGQWWDDPVTAAHVDVALRDVDAGLAAGEGNAQ